MDRASTRHRWHTYLVPVPAATLLLAAALLTVFALQRVLLVNGLEGVHDALFVLDRDRIGYAWAWVTSRFAHLSIGHLRENLVALVVWGPIAERALGWRRAIPVFVLLGAISGLVEIAVGRWTGVTSSVGASGALWGLMAVTLVAVVRRWIAAARPPGRSTRGAGAGRLARWLDSPLPHEAIAVLVAVPQLVALALAVPGLGTDPSPEVGHVSHLAGLVVGTAAAFAFNARVDTT